MNRSSLYRRTVAALLILTCTGCMTWKPLDMESDPIPPEFGVTTESGEQFVIWNPVLDADTLRGRSSLTGDTVAIAVDRLSATEVQQPDGWRTAALVGVILGALALVIDWDEPRRGGLFDGWNW